MSRCLLCGNEAAYDSFQWQWCPNRKCKNFREEVKERPAYLHDNDKDSFLGLYNDSYWGILDLYLSSDLQAIKIRWSSDNYSVASEFIDVIEDGGNIGSMDNAFIEGLKRAKASLGV